MHPSWHRMKLHFGRESNYTVSREPAACVTYMYFIEKL